MNKTLHPEVHSLLDSNPLMTSLPAGHSNQAQAYFKIMRNTNLMRFGAQQSHAKASDEVNRLHEEMLERRRQHEKQVSEHREAVIKAREDKKRLQAENGRFWLEQAEIKRK